MREVMLHRIAQGEKVAARSLESVAERDQFFPVIGRDQPIVFRLARQLFSIRQAEIGHVAIGPNEGMKFLDLADGRAILLAPVNLHRPRFTQLDCYDPWRRIGPEKQLVILESHRFEETRKSPSRKEESRSQESRKRRDKSGKQEMRSPIA